jgi:hypothetical protein
MADHDPLEQNVERLLHAAGVTVTLPEGRRQQILDGLLDQAATQRSVQGPLVTHKIWRSLLKSRSLRVAAAIAFAAVLIWALQGPNSTAIALDDVGKRVEQISAYMFKVTATVTGQMEGMPATDTRTETTVLVSKEHGMRMDQTIPPLHGGQATHQLEYYLSGNRTMVIVRPDQKMYMKVTPVNLTRTRQQIYDPWELIKQVLRCKYKHLDRSMIDGIQVEGFETTDPASLPGGMDVIWDDVCIRLWVGVADRLPVRVDMDFTMEGLGHAQVQISDLKWDRPCQASDFEPNIPEDYTAMAEGIEMPDMTKMTEITEMTEEAAIRNLRFFADLAGRYPKDLAKGLVPDFIEAAMGPPHDVNAATAKADAFVKRAMELASRAGSLRRFYMTLVKGKEDPAYYGEQVVPQDPRVLLRWRVSDTEYRVIFGDLQVETVTAEVLADMEEALALPPLKPMDHPVPTP